MRIIRLWLFLFICGIFYSSYGQRIDAGLGLNYTYYRQISKDFDGIEKLSQEPGFSLDLRLNHWRKQGTKGTAVLQFQNIVGHYEYQHQRHQYRTEVYARVSRYQLLAGFLPLEYVSRSQILELHAGYVFMFLLKDASHGVTWNYVYDFWPKPPNIRRTKPQLDNVDFSMGIFGSISLRAWQSKRSSLRGRFSGYASVTQETGGLRPFRGTLDIVFSQKIGKRTVD